MYSQILMSGYSLPLTFDPNVGRKLGKYEILCRLSTGGMSEIFLAFQKGLAGFRKPVVLKRILPDIQAEEAFVRMFLDEAQITASLNHPNIAQTYDLDVDKDELFLAMEFVPGATLLEAVKASRDAGERLPLGLILSAVRDTALALHYAHNFIDPSGRPRPVIHRDIAEKNIMVTYDGTTKLLDFGVAKADDRFTHTAVSSVKGSVGYMSPEQLASRPIDARSDVFSLGVVLHQCLTGVRLFYAPKPEDELMAPARQEARPPSRRNADVPPELDAVVLRALEKRPENRFQSALAFARALEEAAGELFWRPEQSGELVQRLFDERRVQTRHFYATSAGTDDGDARALEGLLPRSSPVRMVTPLQAAGPITLPAPSLEDEVKDAEVAEDPQTVIREYPWSEAVAASGDSVESTAVFEPRLVASQEFTLVRDESPSHSAGRDLSARPLSIWAVALAFLAGVVLCVLLVGVWTWT
ncbi:MAG TPA: serine/threonine-protein kinase [Myxococcaceae bacterium]|nr:serine/threonine-protein kinase [Myxococcaceae bacterium]